MNRTSIGLPRALAGFLAGTAFVLAIYSFLMWPAWQPVLIIGGGAAVIVIALLGIPAFLLLRKRNVLSIYVAAALGGIFCATPSLYLAVSNILEGNASPHTSVLEFLTWLLFFVLPGIGGGITGWLVAAGFRIRA